MNPISRPGYDDWAFHCFDDLRLALSGPSAAWIWLGTLADIREGISRGHTRARLAGTEYFDELFLLPPGTRPDDLTGVIYDGAAGCMDLEADRLSLYLSLPGSDPEETVHMLPAPVARDLKALLTGCSLPFLPVEQEPGIISPPCPDCGAKALEQTHSNAATCSACGAVALGE